MSVVFHYKTKPYKHQEDALHKSYDKENFAYFMEMGCGKSKVLIDNIAWLYWNGKIDTAILAEFTDARVDDLIRTLKAKDFPAVRKWVVANLDNDPSVLLRKVYDAMYSNLEGPSIAAAVLIIAKYQYQIAFVADQEINLLAALTEIMVECEFK